jgi:hypothetical protein
VAVIGPFGSHIVGLFGSKDQKGFYVMVPNEPMSVSHSSRTCRGCFKWQAPSGQTSISDTGGQFVGDRRLLN